MKLSELKKTQSKKEIKNPLFKLENKLNLKTLIWFSVIGGLIAIITILMFGATKQLLTQADIDLLPDFLKDMLTINTYSDYFFTKVGQTWILISSVFSGYLAHKLVADNLKDGSFRLLYTQNISRTKIINTKAMLLIIYTVLINAVLYLVSMTTGLIANYKINQFVLFQYALFAILVSLIVGMILFSITLFAHKKINSALAIILVFALYFIAMLTSANDSFYIISLITPFTTMFDFNMTVGFTKTVVIMLSSWLGINIILYILSLKLFNKKDLI